MRDVLRVLVGGLALWLFLQGLSAAFGVHAPAASLPTCLLLAASGLALLHVTVGVIACASGRHQHADQDAAQP